MSYHTIDPGWEYKGCMGCYPNPHVAKLYERIRELEETGRRYREIISVLLENKRCPECGNSHELPWIVNGQEVCPTTGHKIKPKVECDCNQTSYHHSWCALVKYEKEHNPVFVVEAKT